MIDQYNSLAEKFIKKGIWLYLFSFIIAPIWYIIKIIISWELSVSEVWILYWIISLITLLSSYNDLWMTESLNHFIPKFIVEKRYDKVKSILFYALFLQIITSLIIAFWFFFWADYIANNYFKSQQAVDILKVFAVFFIWLNIFQTLNKFFIAVQNTFLNKITEFFRMIFIILSVFFIFITDNSSLLNFSYSWLVWLYIWLLIALFIFYKKYYKKYFKKEKIIINKKLIKEIFKYAVIVSLWTSAATILWQMDMQMIIYFLWSTQAGYYTNYLSIIWIPFVIIWPIYSFLFPVFSELYAKWEIEKIKKIKTLFTKNFIAIAIMFNIFMFIFAEMIAYTLFWERFITSWIILKYSILLLVFNFLLQINFHLMAWIWRVKQRVKIILIAIIFNFITNLILLNIIWVYWAALATWIWWILIYVLSEIFLWKKYFIKLDYKFLWKNIILFLLFWIILNKIGINNFEEISRLKSFIYLWFYFIVWTLIFISININEFKIFISEIKKIKK